MITDKTPPLKEIRSYLFPAYVNEKNIRSATRDETYYILNAQGYTPKNILFTPANEEEIPTSIHEVLGKNFDLDPLFKYASLLPNPNMARKDEGSNPFTVFGKYFFQGPSQSGKESYAWITVAHANLLLVARNNLPNTQLSTLAQEVYSATTAVKLSTGFDRSTGIPKALEEKIFEWGLWQERRV